MSLCSTRYSVSTVKSSSSSPTVAPLTVLVAVMWWKQLDAVEYSAGTRLRGAARDAVSAWRVMNLAARSCSTSATAPCAVSWFFISRTLPCRTLSRGIFTTFSGGIGCIRTPVAAPLFACWVRSLSSSTLPSTILASLRETAANKTQLRAHTFVARAVTARGPLTRTHKA